MKLKIYSSDFSSSSETEESGIQALEGDKGVVALKQYLVALSANLRQGNACAKDRGDVSGSGKKPYRQKGTGMARHGSKRSPIWVGGGVVFGPKPRDYSQKVNKQTKRLALTRALSEKAASGSLCMINELKCEQPKTKILNEILKKAFGEKSVLFVDENFDRNFILASGNIARAYVCDGQSLNAFDVLRYNNVIISTAAMKIITMRLSELSKEQIDEKF